MYLRILGLLVLAALAKGQKEVDNGPESPDQIYLTTCTDRENQDLYNQKLCECKGADNQTDVEEKDRDTARHLVCSCDSRTFRAITKPALKMAYDITKIEIHQAAEGQIEPRGPNSLNNPSNQKKDPLRFALPPNTQTIIFNSCDHIKFMGTLKPESLEDITINRAKSFTLETSLSKDLKSLKIQGPNQRAFDDRTKFIVTGMKEKPIINDGSTGAAALMFESVYFPETSGDLFKSVRAKSIEIKSSKFENLNSNQGTATIFGEMVWESIQALKITNTEIGSIFELGLDRNHGADHTITFIGNEIKSTCDKRMKSDVSISECFVPENKVNMATYINNTIICKCEENGEKCRKNETGITSFLGACKEKTLAETACSDAVGEPPINLLMMKAPTSNCEKECSTLDICLITLRNENPTTAKPVLGEEEGIKQWTLILIIIFILLGAGCLFLTIIFCFPDLFKLKAESTMYKPTEADRGEEGLEIPDDEPSYKQLVVNETNQTEVQSI